MEKQSRDLMSHRGWQIVNATSLVLGLIASVVSILAFFRIGEVQNDLRFLAIESKGWQLTITLAEPKDQFESVGNVARISGSVDLRVTAADMKLPPPTNLILQEKQIKLIPFVRPLSQAWWWAQGSPLVKQDGSFEGGVHIGTENGLGVGVDHEIVVLAVPAGATITGDKIAVLPFFYAASNTVTIRRIQ